MTPLNNGIATTIAAVCLFSTGHWIGGTVLVVLIVTSIVLNAVSQ